MCWHKEITYIVLWNPHRLARCVLLFHFSDEETETGSFRTSVGVAWGAACMLSPFIHVRLYATLWTVARQSPLSMGFSRQEYWSGLPCPPPGDLPDPGIEIVSLTSNLNWQAGSLPLVLCGWLPWWLRWGAEREPHSLLGFLTPPWEKAPLYPDSLSDLQVFLPPALPSGI